MDLKLLQQHEMNLLQQIVRICDTAHIDYWLTGGSMLGAVKYKGMIPWDDDIDVSMKRADYDRFIVAANSHFQSNDRYDVISDLTDHDYGITWAKIVDNQTRIKEDFSFSSKTVFVDIIPLDNVADKPLTRFWDKNIFHIVDQLVKERYSDGDHRGVMKVFFDLAHTMTKNMSLAQLKRLRYRIMTRHNDTSTTKLMNYASWYAFGREWVHAAEVKKLQAVPFNDTKIKIPAGAAAILKRMYGDIHRTPSAAEQQSKHIQAFKVVPIDKKTAHRSLPIDNYFETQHLDTFARE
ncbi:LicD family protein [Loigolactobacillus binensis]|uniref:Phosphorylcholine transferase LicD n=1 Tax=Loigolactobacillus binensis TaxID=2559922 RepID=A0ABW3EDL9_9LACO|nr:LicD family protein [Loigolactobacillus binensis]